MNVFFSSQPYTAVIFSHPCIINDMMSRIRDGNGLIVASRCLTRNRERDVIISTMTSCPPPGLPGTVHCTWHCTEQYRSLYPSSVSKKRSSDLTVSSKQPPLVSNLSVTHNTGFVLPVTSCDVRARVRSEPPGDRRYWCRALRPSICDF